MSDTTAAPASAADESAPRRPTSFLVSSAPHLAVGATTQRIMFEVVLAMTPLLVAAIYFFRFRAIILCAATLAGCLVAEAVANLIRGRRQASLLDGSAVVTGMILAFSLPPSLNAYMAFIGGCVAIALGKAVFGGLGHNLFNPAMVGRAFLMICFPAALGTVWTEPITLHTVGDPDVDGVTMATPLTAAGKNVKADEDERMELPRNRDLLIGKVSGCLGETSTLAALIGGLYLVIRRVADWRPVVGVLGSVILFAAVAHAVAPGKYEGIPFHLFSGALMFGAFFIATDYVGAPITPKGRVIFGVGVGVLVMVIRLFGAYPEGFMFAILIMNAATPLIERWTTPTPFGGHVQA